LPSYVGQAAYSRRQPFVLYRMQIVRVRPRARLRPLAAVALTGFGLSLGVHALTYAGVPAPHGVFGLHLGAMVVFAAFVFSASRWQGGRRLEGQEWQLYFPRWVRIFVPALMAYMLMNFRLATHNIPKRDKDTPYSALTPEVRLYETRAFSGHWLFFYGIPALFFLYVPRGARQREDGSASR
jgi:hypothetical protein